MMKKIDAHVHVFGILKGFRGEGELYPLGGGRARWANGQTVDMIPPDLGDKAFETETCYRFLKEKGVEKAVLLQGSFYGIDNEYTALAVKNHPDMFIGAGSYDPFTRYADQIYDRLTKELGFRILKFETSSGGGFMSYHPVFDIAEVFSPIAAKCAQNGQVLVLDIGSPGMESFQPESVKKLAVTWPELKIVVCHLFAATRKDAEEKQFEELKKSFQMLALPNVYFDLAAVPFNVWPEEYPYPTGLRFIRTAKEIVGVGKLMWGTDLPSVLFKSSYEQLSDYIIQSGFFTEPELEQIFYKNALEVYPFDVK